MHLHFFLPQVCPDCDRLTEEGVSCPWCQSSVPLSRTTRIRLVGLFVLCCFSFLPTCPWQGPFQGLLSLLFTTWILSQSVLLQKHSLEGLVTAVVFHGIQCAFPATFFKFVQGLNAHAYWFFPTVFLIALIHLPFTPPVPLRSPISRLFYCLKTPAIFLVGAMLVCHCLRLTSSSPYLAQCSAASLAWIYLASCTSLSRGIRLTFLAGFLLLFVAPCPPVVPHVSPILLFAMLLAPHWLRQPTTRA